MSKRLILAMSLLLLISLALAACSSGTGGGTGQGGNQTVDLEAADIEWNPKQLNVNANQPVQINIKNTGALEHSFKSDALGVAETKVAPGATGTVTFTPAQAGTFDFICAIPGHADAGMVGTITVR